MKDQRIERVPEAERELEQARAWISDLQAGMYINCVYCGHRYGPDDKVPATMADALKAHIEVCEKHPMSMLKQRAEAAEARAAANAKDAERYRVLRLFVLPSGYWDEKKYPGYPGLLGWSGTHAGAPYSEGVIDKMMDGLIGSEWTRKHCPAIDAAIEAGKGEGK